MAEEVSTGGLKSFNYTNSGGLELDEERKRAIEEGYAQASVRKAKEKRNKLILWVVIVLIMLGLLGFWILR